MKDFKRYILEFFLVFLSIFAAFLFENYRVQLEEEDNYLSSLSDFKSDVRRNIGQLNYEISDSARTGYTVGYRNTFRDDFTELLKTSNQDPTIFMPELIVFFKLRLTPPVEWIYQSEQYQLLMSNHIQHIKSDSLKAFLPVYKRRFEQRRKNFVDEQRAWYNIVNSLDNEFNLLPKDSLYYQTYEDENRYDLNSPRYAYLKSKENRKQYRATYHKYANLIYTLRKINGNIRNTNRTMIREFSRLKDLVEDEEKNW